MKVAVEGCCHGELDAIYSHINTAEARYNYRVDLLLICGDFQAVRNHQDLQCMAVPAKYRQLGGFYKYYTGEKTAPILTIIIGGNHEASNYLWELYHGGWVAPNIYFLGCAGCVQVNGLRIAGASGIFKSQDFRQGHWENLPYDHGSMRSIYHIREFNVRRLSLLSSPHIFLSHDWPQSIEHHGDIAGLLRRKPFFRADVNAGKLGSPPLMGLLRILRPQWWFAAHLHVRFVAEVVHGGVLAEGTSPEKSSHGENPDEIAIEDDDDEAPAVTVPRTINEGDEEVTSLPQLPPRSETKFLALDKCVRGREFLEILDIPTPEPITGPEVEPISDPLSSATTRPTPKFTYDPEWLAITRAFHPYFSTSRVQTPFPSEAKASDMIKAELDWVVRNVRDTRHTGSEDDQRPGMRDVLDCQVFAMTAPGPGSEGDARFQQPRAYSNPQTEAFCAMLGIENKIR